MSSFQTRRREVCNTNITFPATFLPLNLVSQQDPTEQAHHDFSRILGLETDFTNFLYVISLKLIIRAN